MSGPLVPLAVLSSHTEKTVLVAFTVTRHASEARPWQGTRFRWPYRRENRIVGGLEPGIVTRPGRLPEVDLVSIPLPAPAPIGQFGVAFSQRPHDTARTHKPALRAVVNIGLMTLREADAHD